VSITRIIKRLGSTKPKTSNPHLSLFKVGETQHPAFPQLEFYSTHYKQQKGEEDSLLSFLIEACKP